MISNYCNEYGEEKVSTLLDVMGTYLCGCAAEPKKRVVGQTRQKNETLKEILARADQCPVIMDYLNYRKYLQSIRGTDETANQKVKIDKILGTVSEDMIIAYNSCFPKVNPAHEMHTYYENDFSLCDYSDFDQVYIILTMPKYPATHPCFPVREDIRNMILDNKDKFTKREISVAEVFYDTHQVSYRTAAMKLNIPRPNVYYYLKVVARKIVRIELSHRKANESQEL